MTDQEPDPFSMSTDPTDEGDPGEEQAGQPAADEADETDEADEAQPNGAESIADLIDEASRTVAEQAESEASGAAPQDQSADVWGDVRDAGSDDADAVWAQTEEPTSDHDLWMDDGDDADVWQARQAGRTPLTADPELGDDPHTSAGSGPPAAAQDMGLPADEEPDTFTFSIDGDDGDLDDGDIGEGDVTAAPTGALPPSDEADEADEPEEPEPFRFGAGPATSVPMPRSDRPVPDDAEEPEAFSFPVSTDDDAASADGAAPPAEPPTGESAASRAVASDRAADGEGEPDHEPWTLDVTHDTGESDQADAPLAQSATPRTDTGWHDLDAEDEPGWTVSERPDAGWDDEEGADDFMSRLDEVEDDEDDAPWTSGTVAEVDDDAPWTSGAVPEADEVHELDDDAPWTSGTAAEDTDDVDDDAPWSSGVAQDDPAPSDGADTHEDAPWTSDTAEEEPAASQEEPAGFSAVVDEVDRTQQDSREGRNGDAGIPADVVTAEVQDALGDLLGDDDQDANGMGGQQQDDGMDDLADLDLDQFDDLGSPTATADAPAEDEHEPPAATDAGDDEQPDEQQLDASAAAREVMEPGSVSFSSGGKKKKRGFFG